MSNKHIFDQIIDEIRNDPIPEAHLEQAKNRALNKLIQKPSETALSAADVKSISGCGDFQRLIPAFMKKELSEAKMMLVGDHTRSCVPCRKFLQASGRPDNAVDKPIAKKKAMNGQLSMIWRLAAAVLVVSLLGLGYKSMNISKWFQPEADIQIVDGSFYTLSNNQLVLQSEQEVLSYGEVIRTPRDHNSMVELPDGSRIEFSRRSVFSIDQSDDGTTINMTAGKALVEAADQRDKNLFVNMPDCLVTVKGTVFSVNSGPKGSRVSVLEGEVHVKNGKTTSILLPGNQFNSDRALKPVPLKREIAWTTTPSRLDPFMDLIKEAAQKFEASIADQGTRYASSLLPLMPENTRIYGAFPNIGESTLEILGTIQQQLALYPNLQDVIPQETLDNYQDEFATAVLVLSQLSTYFGNEFAFGVPGTDTKPLTLPLFLSERSGKEGLEEFVRTELSRLEEDVNSHITFVDDPANAQVAPDQLYIWIHSEYIAASPELSQLQDLQTIIDSGQNPAFTSSSFFQTLDEIYQTGVSVVFGADLSELIPEEATKKSFQNTGINQIDDFILIKREAIIDSSFEASLTFKESRQGFASWLAEPSPLESLTFLSQDVSAFISISLIDPEFMLNDLVQTMKSNDQWNDIVEKDEDNAMDLVHDLTVALGGEVTVALDGPILPAPHWKVIAEVYDAELLQETIDGFVDLSNQNNDLELVKTESEFNGQTVFEIKSQKYGWNFYYTFIDGYVLAVPNLSLLEQTQKNKSYNLSLATSDKFISLLPADSYSEFSGLAYQNLSGLLDTASKFLPETTDEDMKKVHELQAAMAPKLVYCYAENDRISVSSTGGDSLLNMLLLRLINPKTQKIDFLEQLFGTPTVD